MTVILLILIFIRPFISSLAFPDLNFVYSFLLLSVLAIWTITRGLHYPKFLKFALGLFCAALAISCLFSKNIHTSLGELYKYVSGLLLLAISSSFNNKEKANTIRVITIAGLVISLAAIYQYYFGFQDVLNYMSQHKINDGFVMDIISRRRVFFPFVTPNTLAGFLIMVIPLALTLKKRILFLLPLVIALILTKSLSGLFCLLLALSLYCYLKGMFDAKKAVFLAGVTIVTVIILFIRANTSLQHTHPLFSSLMRWNYWKQTITVIKYSPLVGLGPALFDLNLSRYTHNSYLQFWAETGILGIASLLWLLFLCFAEGIKKLKLQAAGNHHAVTVGIIASATAFLLHNLLDFSFFLPEISLLWWVILGLMVSRDA